MYRTNRVLRFRPPRIALGLVAIAFVFHSLMPVVLHRRLPLAALAAGIAGFAIMMRAWWLFRDSGTAIRPTEKSSALITTDVYSISRNPMYLGMTLMLTALGLYTGAATMYAAALLTFAILNRHFVPFEERRMREQFGDRFRRYEQRVRRWL